MIDGELLKALVKARANGAAPGRTIAPEVIEQNKRLLEKTVRKRKTIAGVMGLLAYIADILLLLSTENVPLFMIILVGTGILVAAALFFAGRTKKNACPKCFALSPWIHVETREVGQQRTSVTKEVETKHYSSERRPLAGFESPFSTGMQRYEGKSVTKTTVPAVRYDYQERYRCRCCGQIKDVYTHKTVEQ